jgi:large conductance mechanosensitive channel
MLKEFRAFIMRGNVVDLAVGVIIGAAFGKIVTSLVNDVLMPPLGMIIGGLDFSQLAITLKSPLGDAKPVEIRYGLFINNVVDFLVVAFCIFLLVKGINSLKKSPAPVDPTEKKCPHCQMAIPIAATKCGHCTSALG